MHVFTPDNPQSPFDAVVYSGKRFTSAQVKGTSKIRSLEVHAAMFEVPAVKEQSGCGKVPYADMGVDVIALFIEPLDSWYLVPLVEFKGRNMRVYLNTGGGNVSRYLENWNVFTPTPEIDDVI